MKIRPIWVSRIVVYLRQIYSRIVVIQTNDETIPLNIHEKKLDYILAGFPGGKLTIVTCGIKKSDNNQHV